MFAVKTIEFTDYPINDLAGPAARVLAVLLFLCFAWDLWRTYRRTSRTQEHTGMRPVEPFQAPMVKLVSRPRSEFVDWNGTEYPYDWRRE